METTEIALPDEFASTMQQLAAEAEKTIPHVSGRIASDRMPPLQEEVAILNERIGGLGRMLLGGFEKILSAQPVGAGEAAAQMARMEEHLIAIRNSESVNQRLFNSLHEELKHYRDNFLRDSLQKPFIRDLVILFDDLTSLAAQMENANAAPGAKKGSVRSWHTNLDNAIHSLVEILHRMEVNEIEPKEKVDRALHRVVSYEPADFAEDDGRIVMRIKRGFIWHEQVLRPEEVVAKRFN